MKAMTRYFLIPVLSEDDRHPLGPDDLWGLFTLPLFFFGALAARWYT